MGTLDTHLATFLQWLGKTTLQGSLLICLIILIQVTLRERLPARWRYCLWLVLLLRLSLPWSPQSAVSIYRLYEPLRRGERAQPASTRPPAEIPSSRQARAIEQGDAGIVVDDDAGPRPTVEPTPDSERRSPAVSSAEGGTTVARWAGLLAALPVLWLIGVVGLGGYILARSLWLWQAVVSERPVTDQQVLDLLEDCKMQMRVKTIVGVVITDRTGSPALFGFIRPRILLPQGLLETLSLEDLYYIFVHELAHLKRRDVYLAWLVCLLQVLHWFNPLIWFAFRRMRADQEMATDALALSTVGTDEPYLYGKTIVNLLERFSRPQYLPSLAGILENPSHIERRMAMIARFTRCSYRWSPLGIAAVAVLGIVSMIDPTRGAVSTSPAPQAKPAITMRMVQPVIQNQVSMSPDGRYLCGCGTWAEAGEGIAVRELTTGEQRTIKPTKPTPEWSDPRRPVLSQDNKRIAYVAARESIGRFDLCLIEADGSGQRVLYPGVIRPINRPASSEPPLPYPGMVQPIQWFPDGNRLLALRWPDPTRALREIEIVSVSVSDGSVQVIKTLTGEFFGTTVRLSPDAKYVAYDAPSKDAPEKRDIFAIEIDSQKETPIVRHPADDKLLDWTPDGRHLLFLRDRAGAWSAWLLPIEKGQVQGTPELVAPSMGNVGPVGFAQNGSYYYRLAYSLGGFYTAAMDVTTGQLLSGPVPLEITGSAHGPDWSPDGKYLAYCSRPLTATAGEPGVIRIRSLATGEERELVPKIPTYFRRIRWSPAGRSFLASQLVAYKLEDTAWPMRVCRIDVETGDSTVLLDTKPNTSNVSLAELSPDGKILYYSGGPIFRRQLDTGEEEEVFTGNRGQALWALSPNGEFIATGCNEGTEKKDMWEGGIKRVLVIPSQGGAARELVRWDDPAGVLTNFAWSRDSKTVLFILHRDPVKGKNLKQIDELWQVATDGGQPRKITESDLGLWYDLRVHPDGQRIAFWTGLSRSELWVMENFLPAGAGTKESK